MNEFIHSFSIKRRITKREHASLLGKNNTLFLYNSTEKFWILKYQEISGFRIKFIHIKNDSPLRVFDSNHPMYEAEIIISPAKLLNPSINLGGITDKGKIEDACRRLSEIIQIIEEFTGVDLLHAAKLYRVDLTKDVITPNELYTHAIIEAAKKSINRYGYKRYDPRVHPDYTLNWYQEDSMMFKSKKVWGKLYNKKRDLLMHKHHSEYEKLGDNGLLRFEVSVLRDILRDDYSAKGYISLASLPEILYQITLDGNMLLNKYFVNTFYDGAMLSRSVLKKYLNKKCKRTKTAKSMMDFSDWIRKMKSEDLKYYDTLDGISSMTSRFNDLRISPVQVNKGCPYIPSFSDMLNETVNDMLLSFAWQATDRKHKELTYWNIIGEEMSAQNENFLPNVDKKFPMNALI